MAHQTHHAETPGAQIIDGKALAERFRADIARRAAALRAKGRPARLDALIAGDADSGARVYAINQGKTCEALGIDYNLVELSGRATFDDVAGRVLLMSTDDDISAIMVHMPMPEGVDAFEVQRRIAPEKDVEGVNPANIGNIVYGHSSLVPCTALATLKMIESTGVDLKGKRCVVVGASNIVGKPIAVLLMRHEATVISCNKFTADITALTRSADVLIAAAGAPELVRADWVKPGAIVVDVGLSRVAGPDGKMKTVGDVAFDEVRRVAGWISPVPGGVGPMTVAMLLHNVVEAAER
ncbi:MAG: bifunctional 5,10-methylenetetrahydrofolate dehydrogenase/5,10-methenyltetrahydrofolate cyclohydrolase [Phycisphaeraceae bacterium]|nr:bifunctional 5,10-methylenetetrahydrofolate dehydrogenase/5,10-methenyltetrahydrofolate cyclohydrolase [Phycisphaeraceae bacterium]